MINELTEKELITTTIDRYTELQQIKKANGCHENKMLDYFIKVTIAKLSSSFILACLIICSVKSL